jgi:hypothetical protein
MPVAMQQQGDTCRWLCNSREMQADSTAKTGRYKWVAMQKQGDTGGYPIAMIRICGEGIKLISLYLEIMRNLSSEAAVCFCWLQAASYPSSCRAEDPRSWWLQIIQQLDYSYCN